MNNPPIPTTARQAFKILDGLTTPEEKAAFLSKSKAEFVIDEHFDLGAWIRNNWIYAAEGGEPVFEHPDMISEHWLERYYEHLKRVAKPSECPANDE